MFRKVPIFNTVQYCFKIFFVFVFIIINHQRVRALFPKLILVSTEQCIVRSSS